MIAVIFEVEPAEGQQEAYLEQAAAMRPLVEEIEGFISVERFESLSTPGKLLSLSYFRDEAAVEEWRRLSDHRAAQAMGREEIFEDYSIKVTEVLRDYGKLDRAEAPEDSLDVHDGGGY